MYTGDVAARLERRAPETTLRRDARSFPPPPPPFLVAVVERYCPTVDLDYNTHTHMRACDRIPDGLPRRRRIPHTLVIRLLVCLRLEKQNKKKTKPIIINNIHYFYVVYSSTRAECGATVFARSKFILPRYMYIYISPFVVCCVLR